MKLTWNDTREIGELLYELHEEVDPLSISFVQLHKWICALDDFDDDPKARKWANKSKGNDSDDDLMNNKASKGTTNVPASGGKFEIKSSRVKSTSRGCLLAPHSRRTVV